MCLKKHQSVTPLIFAQEYSTEVVIPSIRLPARISEAITTVTQIRTPEAQRRRPRVIPVFPQPRPRQICALALPRWPSVGVAVLFDRHVIPPRTFSAVVPHVLSRAAILFLVGLEEDAVCAVFCKDVPWHVPVGKRLP